MGQLCSSCQCDSRGYEGTYVHAYVHSYGDIDIDIHVIAVVMLLTSLTIVFSSMILTLCALTPATPPLLCVYLPHSSSDPFSVFVCVTVCVYICVGFRRRRTSERRGVAEGDGEESSGHGRR